MVEASQQSITHHSNAHTSYHHQRWGSSHLLKGKGLSAVKEAEKRVTFGVWLKYVDFNLLLPKVVKSPLIIEFFLRCDWSPDFIWFYYQS